MIIAAFIGHGATLLPMHLHARGHQNAQATPTYMVHGAIDNFAFGMGVSAKETHQDFVLGRQGGAPVHVKLTFTPDADIETGGMLRVTICETPLEDSCDTAFEAEMDIDRTAPSVLGSSTKSGKPIHVFVQEMA